MNETLIAGLKRFAKGFVAAGLSNLAATMLLANAHFGSLAEAKTWVYAVVIAFVTGGLLGAQKMISFTPTPLAPPTVQQ